jgi:hypothetical protein
MIDLSLVKVYRVMAARSRYLVSTLIAATAVITGALPQRTVLAQATLPKCSEAIPAQQWRDCIGLLSLAGDARYQGEIRDGAASGRGTITQNSGRAFRYVGEVRNNLFDGYGTLAFRDGTRYIGDFAAGIFEGQGNLALPDGQSFTGQFVQGKYHGRGTLISNNGDRYIGEFREGFRHGQGIFTSTSGERFQGEFRDGRYHGKGSLATHQGVEYTGEFRDGLFHGRGTLAFRDGSRYEGDFRAGQRNGLGVFTNLEGERYQGDYRDDKRNGQGQLTRKDGEVYVGEFRDDTLYGKGLYTFPNGEKYEGEFQNDRFNGRGTYTYRDGSTYTGEFRDGNLDGRGTFTSTSGEKYVGEYRRNKRDGRGVLFFQSGNRYVGDFREGKPSGLGIEYLPSGVLVKSGSWIDGALVADAALESSQFPFDPGTGSASPSPTSGASSATVSTSSVNAALVAAEKERIAAIEREKRAQEQKRKDEERRALLGRRLALVIGNASYQVSPLKNPENDANDVSQALKESGFTVIDIRNGSLGKMRQAIRQFGDMLVDHDVGLVYYSGHGVEVNGKNYMLPVNADIQREDEVADQSVDVGLVLEKMATANKAVNILILDACRDDPFGRGFRSRSKGLAVLDAPRGTLIAYATSPGRVADDGQGRNSPYTRNLVRYMKVPNKPVEAMFKDVRRAVQQDTKGAQTPWENTSLSGDFFFQIKN